MPDISVNEFQLPALESVFLQWILSGVREYGVVLGQLRFFNSGFN